MIVVVKSLVLLGCGQLAEMHLIKYPTKTGTDTGASESSLRKFLQEKSSDWRFPTIENLEEYISPFASAKCLVIIDNPRQIDLVGNYNPIIIRALHPITIKFSNGEDNKFGPESLIGLNISSKKRTFVPCPFSDFFMKTLQYWSEEICYHLNFPLYWNHTKPWNCHAQIDIYPPTFYFSGTVWRSERKWWLSQRPPVFPNLPQTSFQILIPKIEEIITTWLDAFSTEKPYYCQPILLIFSPRYSNLNYQSTMVSNKTRIFLVEISANCTGRRSAMSFTSISQDVLLNHKKLIEINFPGPSSNLNWNIATVRSMNSVVEEMLTSLANCKELAPLSGRTWHHSIVDRVAHAFAHVWLSIMRNYTNLQFKTHLSINAFGVKCGHPGTIEFDGWTDVYLYHQVFVKHMYVFPYFDQDELTSLKFVSCGKRGLASIPFEELTNVFDNWIWILILVSTVIVVVPLRATSTSGTRTWSHCISSIKVLLEQGDPFSSSVTSDKRLRFVIGLFLLAGIVLSNAYKNSNVYNMISPRRDIPYEYFKELIKDQVRVYARTVNLLTTLHYKEHSYHEWWSRFGAGQFLEWENHSVVALSEIAMRIYSLQDSLDAGIDKEIALNASSLSLSGVRKWATLGRFVGKSLLKFLNLTSRLRDKVDEAVFKEIRKNATEALMLEDEVALYDDFKRCDKVALILPAQMSHDYRQNLRKEKFAHVYVGKETYHDLNWRFSICGLLSPFLPQRIKGVYEAGIWNRWIKLVRTTESQTVENGEVQAARMDGNTVLIFFLLVSGLSASVVAVILEFSLNFWLPKIRMWKRMGRFFVRGTSKLGCVASFDVQIRGISIIR